MFYYFKVKKQCCSQFHQHFTSDLNLVPIFFRQINIKPNCKLIKAGKNNFTQKVARKMLVKLTPGGQTFFCSKAQTEKYILNPVHNV